MTPCGRKKGAKGFGRAAKPPRPPARLIPAARLHPVRVVGQAWHFARSLLPPSFIYICISVVYICVCLLFGRASHASGGCFPFGRASHASGGCLLFGRASHVSGGCFPFGRASHASGGCFPFGRASHASGGCFQCLRRAQTAV